MCAAGIPGTEPCDADEAVLIPALEAAATQHKVRRVYCEIVSFSGMSPGALWDDLKVGAEHRTQVERVAVVTNIDWISHTTKRFAFLLAPPRSSAQKRVRLARGYDRQCGR